MQQMTRSMCISSYVQFLYKMLMFKLHSNTKMKKNLFGSLQCNFLCLWLQLIQIQSFLLLQTGNESFAFPAFCMNANMQLATTSFWYPFSWQGLFPDNFLTVGKFADISRFSRQVVTLSPTCFNSFQFQYQRICNAHLLLQMHRFQWHSRGHKWQ